MTAVQRYLQLVFATPFLLYTLACDRRADTAKAPPSTMTEAEAAAQSKTNIKSSDSTVRLEPGMMANIKLEELSEKVLPSTLTATGKVNFNEDQMARILTPVAGQVINLRAKVGDSVAKGQELFYINSREAAAAISEYLENRKDLELAEKTYSMTKDLYEHEAASRISLQQAENDLAKAKARTARSEYVLKVFNLS